MGMREREDFEVHLATCSECAGELARYREVISAVGSLRNEVIEPSPGFVARVVATAERPGLRWRADLRRYAHDRRIHVAAASLGGVVVGAGTIALLWWRLAHRAVSEPTRVAAG
jgi:anti-sigma factor RsiW